VRVLVLVTVKVLVYLYVVVTTDAVEPAPLVKTKVLLPTDSLRLSIILSDGLAVVTAFAVETGCMFPFGADVK
jgi:hypothetical protein